MTYTIVDGNKEQLAYRVFCHTKQGWVLQGGVSVCTAYYYQAMTHKEDFHEFKMPDKPLIKDSHS